MKQIKLTSLLLLCFLMTASLASAQLVGKPGGNILNFFNTNAFGGQLGHEQAAGTFGTFGGGSQWIGIGQPTFMGGALPVYGMRIQWEKELATFSMNGSSFSRDLEIQWGGTDDSKGKFFINHVFDQFDPAGERNIMTMEPQGDVGINTTNPAYRLDVRVDASESPFYGIFSQNLRSSGGGGAYLRGSTYGSLNYAFNAPGTGIGAQGYASGASSTSYGVRAYSFGTSNNTSYGAYNYGSGSGTGTTYGTYTQGLGSANTTYGIYATVSGSSPTQFAGYFNGDVTVNGVFTAISDARLKKNVETETAALDKVMKLRPTTYEFKQGEIQGMNLPEGMNHGFIAQELKEVLPELVIEKTHTFQDAVVASEDAENTEEEEPVIREEVLNTVNYLGLIPVLTKAIQEQQEQIDASNTEKAALVSELAELRKELETVKNEAFKGGNVLDTQMKGANVLGQNSPNPFDLSTTISYEVAPTAQTANMIIFDMQGKQVKMITDLGSGEGSVTILGNELEAGMYLYSLIVDGQEVATKRMILTKQ